MANKEEIIERLYDLQKKTVTTREPLDPAAQQEAENLLREADRQTRSSLLDRENPFVMSQKNELFEAKVSALRMQKISLEENIEVAEAEIEGLKRLISDKKVVLKQVKGELSLLESGREQGMLF